MASSPILHPNVREKLVPRMSATTLAEYLIFNADKQENVLHDSRFQKGIIVAANGDAVRALRAYNCDPRRDHSALDKVKDDLTAKAADMSERPKARDEARRCLEAIKLFERHENAFGTRGMALRDAPKFVAINVEGVTLSIRPDFLVEGPNRHIGAGILRLAKAPDPGDCKMDETKQRRNDHRREMARYMVAMLQMLLEEHPELGVMDRDLCFVADVRLGEKIGPAADHTVRLRTIRGACRQIASLWPTIEPRPSVLRRPGT